MESWSPDQNALIKQRAERESRASYGGQESSSKCSSNDDSTQGSSSKNQSSTVYQMSSVKKKTGVIKTRHGELPAVNHKMAHLENLVQKFPHKKFTPPPNIFIEQADDSEEQSSESKSLIATSFNKTDQISLIDDVLLETLKQETQEDLHEILKMI